MILGYVARVATRFAALAALCSLPVLQASAADCAQDTLCRIITDGKLKAGVVVDYKPWGYRGSSGEFLGLEPDIRNGLHNLTAGDIDH